MVKKSKKNRNSKIHHRKFGGIIDKEREMWYNILRKTTDFTEFCEKNRKKGADDEKI